MTYHEHAASVRGEEDENVPESVQVGEVSILPDGAKEAVVDPATHAENEQK